MIVTGKAGLSCTAGPPAEPRQSTTRGRPIDQVMGTAHPNAEVLNLRVVLEWTLVNKVAPLPHEGVGGGHTQGAHLSMFPHL